jgi:hypothetical protein
VDEGIVGAVDSQQVNKELISTSDFRREKNILEMKKAHLLGNEPVGDTQNYRGLKFVKVI